MITDSEFCGSHHLKQMIGEAVASDRFPQSLMLCGEEGLGRNYLARLAARDYLGDVNGLVLRGVHPDCILLRGRGASGDISVEAVRNVSYEVNKAAVMTGMRRVVIIEDAGNLNQSSSAALLKTLEQPPDGVVFLLTVSSPSDVTETVVSRCIITTITAPGPDECYDFLKNLPEYSNDLPSLREYSTLFRGRIGYVIRAIDSEKFRNTLAVAGQFSKGFFSRDELTMSTALDRAENRTNLAEILELSVFCLAGQSTDSKTVWGINMIEKMKNVLSGNMPPKLFSTVLVQRLIEG